MTIQLNFTKPLDISREKVYDKIHFIVINETDIFRTVTGRLLKPSDKNLTSKIIKQMPLGDLERNMVTFAEGLKGTLQGATGLNLAAKILLGSSM